MGREPPNKLGPRKRVRKRKRRAVSSSSSSSSSSSDSDTGAVPQKPKVLSPVREPVLEASVSESSSDSDSDTSREAPAPPDAIVIDQPIKDVPSKRISPSPSPPPRVIPSFIPPINGTEKDIQLKDRFRKFWMESIADGFRDDLEEIHKEPNLDTSRLSLLINSLASGADVFTSSSGSGNMDDVNEMELVLESRRK